MAYRIGILSKRKAGVPASRLRERPGSEGRAAEVEFEAGDEEAWDRIALSHRDGEPMAFIERGPIPPAESEASELAEYAEEIGGWGRAMIPDERIAEVVRIANSITSRNHDPLGIAL
jgi:hypothetical protein